MLQLQEKDYVRYFRYRMDIRKQHFPSTVNLIDVGIAIAIRHA